MYIQAYCTSNEMLLGFINAQTTDEKSNFLYCCVSEKPAHEDSMEDVGWVLVGQTEIEWNIQPDLEKLTFRLMKTLDEKIKEIRAEAEKKCAKLEVFRQKLLALP